MKTLLISKCLLGENVRYDGGNCHLGAKVLQDLEKKYNLIPLCPELLAGLGVPRNPIELRKGKIFNEQGNDLTPLFFPVLDDLKNLVKKHQIEFALLKEDSPSCGVKRVYSGNFDGEKIDGQGLITSYLRDLGVIVCSELNVEKLL